MRDRGPEGPEPSVLARDEGLRRAMDAAAHAVLVVDRHAVVRYVNASALTHLRAAEADLLGADVFGVVRELPELGVDRQFFGDPRSRPRGSGLEVEVLRRDGTRFPGEVTLVVMPTEVGVATIVSIADITARHEAAARLDDLNRAYLTLARMNQVIVRATDEGGMLEDACRVAVDHGGFLGAWVARPGPAGSLRPVARAGAVSSSVDSLALTLDESDERGHSPTARAMRTNATVVASDFEQDERTRPWAALAAEHGVGASVSLPLRVAGECVAVLSLYLARADLVDDTTLDLVESVADNISYGLETLRSAVRLELVAAHRSELLRRLVTAQEEERARIAVDVHDDSVQSLAAVDLRLGMLQRMAEAAAPEMLPSLAQVQRTVETVAAGLRGLLFELEPADPDVGMAGLLRDSAAHVLEHARVDWEVVETHPGRSVPEPVRVQALRIVREALVNVRRHARADRVVVTVDARVDGVEISVADDGVGIPPDLVVRPEHRGLTAMRDRAELAGGWCELEAAAPGTVVRLWVPGTTTDHASHPLVVPSH